MPDQVSTVDEAVKRLNKALKQDGSGDVYVSANSLNRYGVSAAGKVDPGAVAKKAESIVSGQESGVAGCKDAARLFDFVREQVDYSRNGGGFTHGPVKTIRKGGNCVDQTVLLCSLLESQGFLTRIFSIGKSSGGHMLPGVSFGGGSKRRIHRDLSDYFTDGVGGVSFSFASQVPVDEESRYYIADPEYSDYIGDISSLADDGYVDDSGRGWSFKDLRRSAKPRDEI